MSQKTEYVVLGLNRTGRALALMLGLGRNNPITLIDDETVTEAHYPQGYGEVDLNMNKAEAVKATILETANPKLNITCRTNSDEALKELSGKINGCVLFCCKPISNKSKHHIWKTLVESCQGLYFVTYSENGQSEVSTADGYPELAQTYFENMWTGKENLEIANTTAARAFFEHLAQKEYNC